MTGKELNIDTSQIPIRIIRVGSELLTNSMRAKIKEAWGENISVTQDYGMTETLGPGLAMECQCEKRMHLNDNFYFELIDPITNQPTKIYLYSILDEKLINLNEKALIN